MGQFVQLLTFVSVWLTFIRGAFAMEPGYVGPLDRIQVTPLESARALYMQKREALRVTGHDRNLAHLVVLEYLNAMNVELNEEHQGYRDLIRAYLGSAEEYAPFSIFSEGSLLSHLAEQEARVRQQINISILNSTQEEKERFAKRAVKNLFLFYGIGVEKTKKRGVSNF